MFLTVLRLAMLPVGISLLTLLVTVSQDRIKQIIGVMLLAILLTQWVLKVEPRERLALPWTVLAGATSELLAGLVGMGGPAIALWATAHRWSHYAGSDHSVDDVSAHGASQARSIVVEVRPLHNPVPSWWAWRTFPWRHWDRRWA